MFVGKQGITAFYQKSRLPILLPAIYAAIFFINSTSDLKASSNIFEEYQTKALPVLKKHCFPCHDSTVGRVKGNLDLARIQPEIIGKQQEDSWSLVLKKIQSLEMPPKSKPALPGKDLQTVTYWIRKALEAADKNPVKANRVVMRRLNNHEYENTMRDLLGVPLELRDMLPQDNSSNGFDNIADAQHTSLFLMDKYLEGADKALKVAIANFPQPRVTKKRYTLKEMHPVRSTSEKVFRHLEDGTVVCFSSSPWQAVTLSSFYPPDRGKYRFRIAVSGFQSQGKHVVFRVDAGTMWMNGKNQLVSYYDAPSGQPTVIDIVQELEPRGTIRILPYGLANSQAVHKVGADQYEGPGLAVHWIEVEGPLNDSWPPESHRMIFGDLPGKPAPAPNASKRIEVYSEDALLDAEKILKNFAGRAFRRKVKPEEIQPYMDLVKARLSEKYTFEQALRVALMGILVSKDFLFLREGSGKLDDFAIASRLSYFLWSSMPDNELLSLAESGTLHQPNNLRSQVDRMLESPRSSAFTKNFTGQWLNLREIDSTIPSHILYPEYDEMLKASMLQETNLFFEEVLKHDLSIANFIASDFSMLNGRLARHYGIEGIDGWQFRKVTLPKESHRGGLLTMASILKVTANGTYTSPVLRGAWVLERIMGTPPPRPPEGIAAVEPDIRGATTIREQLAKHRSVESCASCHIKIDPPGFALESFDVIGGWREYYRTSGNGKTVTIDNRRMPYLQGKPVDPSDAMPDGKKFRNIDEFKQLLLQEKDQVARSLAEKLVAYATGGPVKGSEQSKIDAIVSKISAKDYGFRSLIHEIVLSDLFLAN
jgi:Protein of unknown function (DUF1592)/Protein of unknown function (DUF1588)/Protein of unknown function (DUF1585)/Protein of unknown function (DUF1587)/Protein of unknown function (DUF1595)